MSPGQPDGSAVGVQLNSGELEKTCTALEQQVAVLTKRAGEAKQQLQTVCPPPADSPCLHEPVWQIAHDPGTQCNGSVGEQLFSLIQLAQVAVENVHLRVYHTQHSTPDAAQGVFEAVKQHHPPLHAAMLHLLQHACQLVDTQQQLEQQLCKVRASILHALAQKLQTHLAAQDSGWYEATNRQRLYDLAQIKENLKKWRIMRSSTRVRNTSGKEVTVQDLLSREGKVQLTIKKLQEHAEACLSNPAHHKELLAKLAGREDTHWDVSTECWCWLEGTVDLASNKYLPLRSPCSLRQLQAWGAPGFSMVHHRAHPKDHLLVRDLLQHVSEQASASACLSTAATGYGAVSATCPVMGLGVPSQARDSREPVVSELRSLVAAANGIHPEPIHPSHGEPGVVEAEDSMPLGAAKQQEQQRLQVDTQGPEDGNGMQPPHTNGVLDGAGAAARNSLATRRSRWEQQPPVQPDADASAGIAEKHIRCVPSLDILTQDLSKQLLQAVKDQAVMVLAKAPATMSGFSSPQASLLAQLFEAWCTNASARIAAAESDRQQQQQQVAHGLVHHQDAGDWPGPGLTSDQYMRAEQGTGEAADGAHAMQDGQGMEGVGLLVPEQQEPHPPELAEQQQTAPDGGQFNDKGHVREESMKSEEADKQHHEPQQADEQLLFVWNSTGTRAPLLCGVVSSASTPRRDGSTSWQHRGRSPGRDRHVDRHSKHNGQRPYDSDSHSKFAQDQLHGRARSRSADKMRRRSRSQSRSHSRSRHRGSGHRHEYSKSRSHSREARHGRGTSRHRDRCRSTSRQPGRGQGSNRRQRSTSRHRGRERSTSRQRNHTRSASRQQDRGRSRSRQRDHGRSSSRQQEHKHSASRQRDRGRSTSRQVHHSHSTDRSQLQNNSCSKTMPRWHKRSTSRDREPHIQRTSPERYASPEPKAVPVVQQGHGAASSPSGTALKKTHNTSRAPVPLAVDQGRASPAIGTKQGQNGHAEPVVHQTAAANQRAEHRDRQGHPSDDRDDAWIPARKRPADAAAGQPAKKRIPSSSKASQTSKLMAATDVSDHVSQPRQTSGMNGAPGKDKAGRQRSDAVSKPSSRADAKRSSKSLTEARGTAGNGVAKKAKVVPAAITSDVIELEATALPAVKQETATLVAIATGITKAEGASMADDAKTLQPADATTATPFAADAVQGQQPQQSALVSGGQQAAHVTEASRLNDLQQPANSSVMQPTVSDVQPAISSLTQPTAPGGSSAPAVAASPTYSQPSSSLRALPTGASRGRSGAPPGKVRQLSSVAARREPVSACDKRAGSAVQGRARGRGRSRGRGRGRQAEAAAANGDAGQDGQALEQLQSDEAAMPADQSAEAVATVQHPSLPVRTAVEQPTEEPTAAHVVLVGEQPPLQELDDAAGVSGASRGTSAEVVVQEGGISVSALIDQHNAAAVKGNDKVGNAPALVEKLLLEDSTDGAEAGEETAAAATGSPEVAAGAQKTFTDADQEAGGAMVEAVAPPSPSLSDQPLLNRIPVQPEIHRSVPGGTAPAGKRGRGSRHKAAAPHWSECSSRDTTHTSVAPSQGTPVLCEDVQPSSNGAQPARVPVRGKSPQPQSEGMHSGGSATGKRRRNSTPAAGQPPLPPSSNGSHASKRGSGGRHSSRHVSRESSIEPDGVDNSQDAAREEALVLRQMRIPTSRQAALAASKAKQQPADPLEASVVQKSHTVAAELPMTQAGILKALINAGRRPRGASAKAAQQALEWEGLSARLLPIQDILQMKRRVVPGHRHKLAASTEVVLAEPQPTGATANSSDGSGKRAAGAAKKKGQARGLVVAAMEEVVGAGGTVTDASKWKNITARTQKLKFGKSKIQGWGMYATEVIEPDTFVIEYIGEAIRASLADSRERQYQAERRDDYMFRIDDEWVIDATMKGGPARFINHCCDPNCYTKIFSVDGQKHIGIYAKRRIEPGEELSYDYKFEIETDPTRKVPCTCGARNCRRWMC